MVSATEIKGQWNRIKGRIKEQWGDFSDNEFMQMQGNTDQLIGVIQKKTGAARQEIERFLDETLHGAGATADSAMEGVRHFAAKATEAVSHAGEAARDQFGRINERMSETYEDAREVVRNQPGVSVGVAFAAGVIGGAIIGILLRPGK
jgi:uncharacterized protein YjbJ (UPF0337 family)